MVLPSTSAAARGRCRCRHQYSCTRVSPHRPPLHAGADTERRPTRDPAPSFDGGVAICSWRRRGSDHMGCIC
eukprot:5677578-Pyramimonas_sp.AAC.1